MGRGVLLVVGKKVVLLGGVIQFDVWIVLSYGEVPLLFLRLVLELFLL